MIKAVDPLHVGDALIIVDVQQDFLPGGALGVSGGDLVIGPLNRFAKEFERRGLPIFATRDWHPLDHCSFRDRGGMWPAHCVAGTSGAAISPRLALPPDTQIISKGTLRESEAYSGFQHTDLAARLRERGCRRLFIGGLATDYCVQATALDALKAGFEVVVLSDAVRSVDARPGDGARALATMMAEGARVTRVGEIIA
jgi:nicotinamidase/pyrazinamidase